MSPQPYFRAFDGWWYVQVRVDGRRKQFKLAKGRDAKTDAVEKCNRLLASMSKPTNAAGDVVAVAMDQFLDWASESLAPSTVEWHRHFCQSFKDHIGECLAISDLLPSHVTGWLKKHPKWGRSTKNCAVRAIRRPIRWYCVEHKLLYPLDGLKIQSGKRRDVYITKEQFEGIVAAVRDRAFKDYLRFSFLTGARPQEVRTVEKRHCELEHSRIVFPASEAKGKEHPRVIYLNDEAKAIVERLLKLSPKGPIFRNKIGKPWDRNTVRCRFRRLRKKVGAFCAYHLRHSFATIALQTVDPITVSVLLGHSDASQLARTYQHVAKNPQMLIEAAKKATA
jgi:integrase